MADKNQLKIANQAEFSDDDPFAELTRIMGFDPRQPATRGQDAPASSSAPSSAQTPAAVPAPVQQDAVFGDDDFSLDLEKELLGSFDLEDDLGPQFREAAPIQNAAPQANSDHGYGQGSTAPGDDFDFAMDFDAAMGIAEGSVSAGAHDAGHAADLGHQIPAPQGFASPEARAPQDRAQDDLEFALDNMEMRGFGHASNPVETPAVASKSETSEVDFGLFEDFDFSLAEEHAASSEPARSARNDVQPRQSDEGLYAAYEGEPEVEIDDSAFAFSGREDQFYAEPERARQPQAFDEPEAGAFHTEPAGSGELAFDELDFAPEPFGHKADYVAAEEPAAAVTPEPARPGAFEFSIPAYVPRKLPVSPMDVAAEEYRQREASPPSSAPAFSMEDELNALLGNLRAPKKAEPVLEPEPVVEPAPPPAPDAYSGNGDFDIPTLDTPYYEQAAEAAFEARRDAPVAGSLPVSPMEVERAQASANVDPGQDEANIDDGMDWEFDETFTLDSQPAPAVDEAPEIYAGSEPQYQTPHHAAYHDDGQPDQAYAAADDEFLEPLDLEEAFGNLADEPQPEVEQDYARPHGNQAYGAAFAGAAAAATAPQAASGLSPSQQQPEMASWNGGQLGQGGDMWADTSHRDPVVRGNPLKEDPLNVIEKLAAQYSHGDLGGYSASQSERDEFDDDFNISEFFDGQPEVETVEVDERSVSLAHDFEIPDLPEEEQVPQASAYDDLDAEFSNLLGDMNAEMEGAKPAAVRSDPLAGGFDAGVYGSAAPVRGNAAASPRARPEGAQPDQFKLDDALYEGLVQPGNPYASNGDYELDPEFEQEYRQPAAERKGPFSRNLLIGGVVAAVAVLGAIGAFALSFGGGQETPTLVRADDGPVKVRPENPGGATVPNQDNKVYDAVAGGTADGAPRQEALVTTAEEPVDVAPSGMEDDDMTMSGKSEDRIEQIVRDSEDSSDAELVAVAPRKVRTMVVRPDGTLVPREDDPAEAADTMSTATPSLPEAEASAALAPAAEDPAPQAAPAAEASEQAPAQVAAATTAAASADGWAMQIASQPSEAAAQTSYQDLARRYPGVLGGRQVNIVRAEVAGKGTFWRVRVMADSRAEAITLCENYKVAGGSCFVSR